MAAINLLPQDLRPKRSVIKLASHIKKILLVALAFYIAVLIALVTSYIFLDKRLKNSLTAQKRLETELKALEETEQRLVLVKDRLEKIGRIDALPKTNAKVVVLGEVLPFFDESILFEASRLNAENIVVAINTANSSSVGRFIALLLSSGKFSTIEISSFQFTPVTGYDIEFVLTS